MQLKDKLNYTLYARPSREIENTLLKGIIFRVIQPLYRVAKLGLY
jgi:hypothetical protein